MKNATRNREMYASVEAGVSLERLAAQHGLSRDRIRTIIMDEENRRLISPADYYRELRQPERR
jgi:Mor family transcriptional regulator